ncbi:uncharacterized protein LOC144330683 [Macaca mulatta]
MPAPLPSVGSLFKSGGERVSRPANPGCAWALPAGLPRRPRDYAATAGTPARALERRICGAVQGSPRLRPAPSHQLRGPSPLQEGARLPAPLGEMSGDPQTDLPAHPAEAANPEPELPADPAQANPGAFIPRRPARRTNPRPRRGTARRRGRRAAHAPRREDSGTVRAPGESAHIALSAAPALASERGPAREGRRDQSRTRLKFALWSRRARGLAVFSRSLASDVGKERRAQERQLETFAG